MADADEIILDGMRKRPRMAEIDKPLGPNNSRPDRKRPLHSGQMSSQTFLRQDPASTGEEELILSCTTDREGPPSHLEENTRRYPDDNEDHDYHVEKRSRTSDWPLRSAIMTSEAICLPRAMLRDQYDKSNSISPPLRAHVKPRPSKFVEGSMKDRASQKPHPSYTEDFEQSWTPFDPKQNLSLHMEREAQPDGYMDHIDSQLVCNSRLEASKSSSIFRFGKSIVAAFNPSTWKIWFKQQEEDSHEKRVLTERHEKAEKIYKELKRTGQLSAFAHQTRAGAQDKMISSDKHDSGVNFEEGASRTEPTHRSKLISVETNTEDKRYGRVFLNPPRIDSFPHCENVASETLVSLNEFPQSSEPTSRLTESLNSPQALRRLPSRKDLQKQQKLVKRVSDLEGKLEAARRQLAEALGDPLPNEASRMIKPRITPGTLPSLPSERLLSVHVGPGSDLSETAEALGIGKAISIDNRTDSHAPSKNPYEPRPDALINASSKICRALDVQKMGSGTADDGLVEQTIHYTRQELSVSPAAPRGMAKKRKTFGAGVSGNDGTYSQNPPGEDDNGFEAAKPSIPKRGPGRPRKLQKIDPEHNRATVEATKAKPGFEDNGTLPFHGRKNKYLKRSPTSPATEAIPQANNSRIPKEDQTQPEPNSPKLMSSSKFTCTGTELSNAKAIVQHDERDEITSVSNSVEVPLIPEPLGVIEPRSAAFANNRVTVPPIKIDVYGDVSLEQKGLGIPNTDVRKSKVGNKQAFEWPADVF